MKLSDFYPQMEGGEPVESPVDKTPQLPNWQTETTPFLRAPLPLPIQYAPDTLRQYNKPGFSTFRTSVTSPAGVPTIQASSQSSSQAVINTIVPTTETIELIVPNIFTPTDQTVTLPGPLKIELASEIGGTVFLSPISGGNGAFDVVSTGSGSSATAVSITAVPTLTNDFAYYSIATIGAGPSIPIPSGGGTWTQQSTVSSPAFAGDLTIYTQPGVSTSLTASAGSPATAWSGILALFATDGTAPTPQQTWIDVKVSTVNVSANITTSGGNTVIVSVAHSNALTKATSASLISALGDTYTLVAHVDDGITGGTETWVYVCIGTTAGTDTITFTMDPGATPRLEMALVDWDHIITISNLPEFAFLTPAFIPPIDLSKVNVKGGIVGSGVLGVAQGGTGLSSPGTSGNVLTSNGTAWVSSPPAGFANPMTTLGDLIDGGVGGTPQRVGIGTTGQVLTVVSGVPTWANASGGNNAVQINGVGVSADKQFFIDGIIDGPGPVWQVQINGVADGG